VYYDGLDEDGNLVGGRVMMPYSPPSLALAASECTTLLNNGPPANRIDIVFVGDGYRRGELDEYAQHVDGAMSDLLSLEPFATYSTFFNVHRVDVISPESGVDHDPTYPIWRDTALAMGFFCGGTERLLCVDPSLAYSHANNAPDVDHVYAVANSFKYGGAGYVSSNLATLAGANGAATQIAMHETGHSLGNLADEYDYGGGVNWTGGEVPEPNVSIMDATEMAGSGEKWAAWLGENQAEFDGLIDCYEGARYYQFGIFRPTANSMMRSLGRPFNLPSVESLVIEMYKVVRPIDDSTPIETMLTGHETVFVKPVDPVDHDLRIRWFLNGLLIPGATSETVNLTQLDLAPGLYTLLARVTDMTPFVRNEAARAQWLTETREWQVDVPGAEASLESFAIKAGSLISGGLGQLLLSDDARLKVASEFTGAVPPYIMVTDFGFQSDLPDPDALDVLVESKVTRNGGVAKIYLRDWQARKWVLVKEYAIGRTEEIKRALDLDAAVFVRDDGEIKMRIRHEMLFSTFDSHIDHVRALVR
jgi:hypothetical protein